MPVTEDSALARLRHMWTSGKMPKRLLEATEHYGTEHLGAGVGEEVIREATEGLQGASGAAQDWGTLCACSAVVAKYSRSIKTMIPSPEKY